MSEIPLGSSYLRFFAQGGAVDEPKFVDEPIDQMADIGGANTPLQDVPTPIVADPVFNPDNVQIDIAEFNYDPENLVDIEEETFEAPSAISSYIQGAVAIPETIGNYFLEPGEESGDIDFIGGSQLLEDAATMGGAMYEGIKAEPMEFLKDMTPGLGQYRAFNRAEELREEAYLLEADGDIAGAEDLRQMAFLEMTDATTAWPMAAGVGTRAARRGLKDSASVDASMSKLENTIKNRASAEARAPNASQFKPEGRRYDPNEPEADRIERVKRDRREFEKQKKEADKPNKADWGVVAYHNTSPDNYAKISEQDLLDPDAGQYARNNTGVWASKSNDNSSTYGAVSMPLRIDTEGFGYVDFMGQHWNDRDIPGEMRVIRLPEPMTASQMQGFIGANVANNSKDIINSKVIDVSRWNTNEIGRFAREMGLPGLTFDNIADRGAYRFLPKENRAALELEMDNGGTTNYMVIDPARIRSEITGTFDEKNRGVVGLSKAEGGEVSKTAWEEINGY